MRFLSIVVLAGLTSCRIFSPPEPGEEGPDLAFDAGTKIGNDASRDVRMLGDLEPDPDAGTPRFVVESEEDFLRGTGFNNVLWGPDGLEIEALVGNVLSTGSFASEVFDGGESVVWDTLTWEPQRPYFFPYPIDGRTEATYPLGNFNSDNLELFSRFEIPAGVLMTGDSFVEQSGNARTIDVQGNVTIAPSVLGTGARFTGNGHLESTSDDANPLSPGSGDFTWTALVFTDECDQPAPVMAMDDLIGNGLLIYLGCVPQGLGCPQTDNFGRFAAGISTGLNELAVACDPSPPRKSWQHLAIVKRASSFSLFMDGERIAQATLPTSALPFDSDIPLKFGRLDSTNSNTSGSVLDEATVFHRALEDFEIKDQVLRFFLGANIDVRTCNDPLCADVPAWDQDNDVMTFADSYGGPSVSLASLPSRRYLQFRVNLASFASDNSPRFGRIEVGVAP